MFLPALFLLSGLLRGASTETSVPTYQHTDQGTGEVLVCGQCPPGTHWAAHCSATEPTQCAPCETGRFTELWNYLPRCLYCSNLCLGDEEVETECSPTNNRVCRCKEGFYMDEDFCVRHDECEPGQGVVTKGTSQMNTVCEECSDGYFSNSSSALDACVKHQECACGQTVLLQGSVYHDTVCGSCQELANGVETLRMFLSGFFSMHRMRVKNLEMFVTRHINKFAPSQSGPLMDEIRDWLAQAPEEQLRKMPEMLRTSGLSNMAEKLEKRFTSIEKRSQNCSLHL